MRTHKGGREKERDQKGKWKGKRKRGGGQGIKRLGSNMIRVR